MFFILLAAPNEPHFFISFIETDLRRVSIGSEADRGQSFGFTSTSYTTVRKSHKLSEPQCLSINRVEMWLLQQPSEAALCLQQLSTKPRDTSCSQPEAVLYSPGNTWKSLETYLIATMSPVGRGQECCYAPYNAMDSPHNKEFTGPKC